MLTGVLSKLKTKAGVSIQLSLVALLASGFNPLQAQGPDPVSDLKNFSSFTANSYASSQIDNVPANYFTGQIKPSLPLFQKKMSVLSFAMSLDWLGGGGLKMDDPGSIVGKGWYLNAGGMIVRNMRDIPDDYKNITPTEAPSDGTTGPEPLFNGILYNSGVLGVGDGEGYPFESTSRSGYYRNNFVDQQHDIFQFNFAGRSGKFYIGKNKEVLIVDGSKLQIIPNYNTSTTITGNEIRSFTIVDEAGIRYTFDQEEVSGSGSGADPGAFFGQSYTTGWMLSKIESPYKEESITIEYYQRQFELHFYGSMYYRRSIRTRSADPYGNFNSFFHGNIGGENNRPFDIKSVTFSDGTKINVNYFDITYSAHDPVVRQIEILSPQSNLIKKFNLNYLSWDRQGQFTYYNFNQVSPLQTAYMPGKEYTHLESISVTTPDNKQSPLYTFSYYLDASHNEAISYNNQSMDYWGYHNGQVNTGDLIPAPFLNSPGANRSVNLEHTLTGALKLITYPTGGSEEFQYELNQRYYRPIIGSPITQTVAGLRLKKRILHDGVNSQNDITKEYRYMNADGSSSGFLGDPLEFRFLVPTYDGGWPGNPHIQFTDTVDVSTPVNPTSFIDGSLVAYKRVEEIMQKGSLSNGKIVYEYSDLSYASTWTPRDYFPYNPVERPTWAIGLPLSTTYYNAQNDPVKQIVNQYDISQNFYQVENYHSLYFALRAHNSNINSAPYFVYKFRNHYPLLGRSDLKKTDTYEYTPAGVLHTVTEYELNPVYHLANKTKTTDSRGRVTEAVTHFPMDYNPGSIPFIDELVSKNTLSMPVSMETWKNDGGAMKLLDATATEFAFANGIQKPSRTFRTAMAGPLSVSNVFNVTVLLNPAYPFQPAITYTKYDNYGRLLSTTTEPGKQKASLILDRLGNTLAKAYNASSAEIAFTSFENEPGGWSYIPSGVTGTEQKTGNMSYIGSLSKLGLPTGNYLVRFWAKGSGSVTVNGVSQAVTGAWAFYTMRVSNINSININTNGNYIDEVAVNPLQATLQSYTYNDDLLVTSESDNSGSMNKNEFDGFGRLLVTRNNEEKIIQAAGYENRQFSNLEKTVTLSNYCWQGTVPGPPVTYKVPANTYVSSLSQADADSKAQWDIDFNSVAYARNTGGCTTIEYNYEISADAFKNDCADGYEGSKVTYTIPYGKYSSLISHDDAQAKAQADLDANKQAYANAHGECHKVVDFYADNYVGVDGYVIELISKATGYIYIYNIPPTTGGFLGQIPAGLYEVHIFNNGGDTVQRSFSIACSYYTEGNSVDIDNVNLTTTCPNVSIM